MKNNKETKLVLSLMNFSGPNVILFRRLETKLIPQGTKITFLVHDPKC